jgi:glycosyltransferase involved in cell wall biosynthesis
MRVLFPTHLDKAANPTSIVLREVARHLPQCTFYSFSQPTTPEDHDLGAWLWRLPQIQCIRPADALRLRFDVVHHHAVTTRALALVRLSKARSLGRCLHVYTAAQVDPQASYYANYLLAVQRANRLVALSRDVAATLNEATGRRADAIIPNGVDLAFFDPQAAQPVVWQQWNIQPPYVLFVGVLNQRKRPDVFMNIALRLPQLTFVLVGDAFTDEARQHYRQMAADYPNVILTGLQPRAIVRDLMAQAVALVFPSEREGLPLTVLEAAAMGLPVLAQPRSSLPEVVHEGITGWLLPVDDLDAWAQKVQEFAGWSVEQRRAFGAQARQFVAEQFSWERAAQQYYALYTHTHVPAPEAA